MPLGNGGFIYTSIFSRNRGGTNRSANDTRQQYFGRVTATGALNTLNGNYGSGLAPTTGNGTTAAATTTSTFTLDSREAAFDRNNHWQGDSATRDNGLFLNAELPLEGGITAYVFGGYTRRDGKSAGFFRRAGDDRTNHGT